MTRATNLPVDGCDGFSGPTAGENAWKNWVSPHVAPYDSYSI